MSAKQFIQSHRSLISLCALAWAAGCESPQNALRDIDPQADPVFKQMCTMLDGAKSLRFHVDATMDVPVETGQLAQFHRSSDITMVRPDRLYAVTESDQGSWTSWYRGTSLTVLDRDANEYATETVPGRIGDMLDYIADNYDVVMPMADFLVGKTYDSMLADVETGEYVGLHEVNDVRCHHLLFRQENIDWQVWIDAGEKPLPRKIAITYLAEPDQPQYVAELGQWELNPAVSEEIFTFTPPGDATSIAMDDLVTDE